MLIHFPIWYSGLSIPVLLACARALKFGKTVNATSMETERQFYEAPSTQVFEVWQEGVICASGDPDGNWFGNEEDM